MVSVTYQFRNLSWLFEELQHLHLDRMDRREKRLVGTETSKNNFNN